MSTIAEIALSKLVFRVIKVEIIKTKNNTKNAPIGVTKDDVTDQRALGRIPAKLSFIGEISAKRESIVLNAPRIMFTFAIRSLTESKGSTETISNIGIIVVPTPKRL